MTFRYLEDSLGDSEIGSYLDFQATMQEPTKTVLSYTLDLAGYLNTHGLSTNYGVFGGYAVLSHLMDSFGEPIAQVWRGSSDIDMGGDIKVLSSIRAGYHVTNDNSSPNIPDKRTLKLDTNGEGECKIDFYLGDVHRKYGPKQINKHFGIPLRVVKPEYIIKGKLMTPLEEHQHCGDILGMLAVLERQGCSLDYLPGILSHEEADALRTRIVIGEREFSRDRLGFFPSEGFSTELKKKLRHMRTVKRLI